MAAEENNNNNNNNNNTNTNTNNNTIATINWYDIINQDTRSLDDVYLGKVKGLYEPLIVIEKGTINKEKLYIPKSVIEKYSANILYLGITEQEAKNIYTRESPPSADEIKQIETITENRILASRRNNIETTEQQKAEVKKQRQHPKSEEEEIIKKLKQAASELKDLLISGAKVAKEKINEGKDITQEKIKEQREAAEERKAENDAKKISKMGDLALQFSTSFDDILSEISLTRTYAEQEQIYKGFIRLIQMQRKLLVARKELAAKLKGAVHEPILINNNDIKQTQLTQDTQNQLNKASELPMPQPQLPKTISTAEEEEEEKIKSKPRIKMVTKKDSDIEVTSDEELPAMSSSSSSSLSSNAATESPSTEIPSTEIPSTEIYSTKREGKEGTTIEKRKLANEKKE
jgi:hypothetical protein